MMETSATRKRLIGGCGHTSDMKRGEKSESQARYSTKLKSTNIFVLTG